MLRLELLRSLLGELDVLDVWTVRRLSESVQHGNLARFLHRVHTTVRWASVNFQLNHSVAQVGDRDGWGEVDGEPAFKLSNEGDEHLTWETIEVFLSRLREKFDGSVYGFIFFAHWVARPFHGVLGVNRFM